MQQTTHRRRTEQTSTKRKKGKSKEIDGTTKMSQAIEAERVFTGFKLRLQRIVLTRIA